MSEVFLKRVGEGREERKTKMKRRRWWRLWWSGSLLMKRFVVEIGDISIDATHGTAVAERHTDYRSSSSFHLFQLLVNFRLSFIKRAFRHSRNCTNRDIYQIFSLILWTTTAEASTSTLHSAKQYACSPLAKLAKPPTGGSMIWPIYPPRHSNDANNIT